MRLVLLGPPGSGKGTQGHLLSQKYKVPHVATGAIIRGHIARQTGFGRQVEAAIADGNFAPDKEIAFWVSERLNQEDVKNGFILDGFPRNLTQAESFEQVLTAVVELTWNETQIMERLMGRLVCPVCDEIYHHIYRPPRYAGLCDQDAASLLRRPDDEPDAIKHRLLIYEDVTPPLRAFYLRRNLLQTVNAYGNPLSVFSRIESALQSRL